MLRGIQQKVIMVRTTKSRVFERAYFIIRDDFKPTIADKHEMIKEANRIILDGNEKNTEKKRGRGRCLLFTLGFLFGAAAAVGGCYLLFRFGIIL